MPAASLPTSNFLAKAPEKVVEGLRKRAGELELLIEKARDARLVLWVKFV